MNHKKKNSLEFVLHLPPYLFLILALTVCIFISTFRSPDWSDEGLYLYDAWAAFTPDIAQSSPFRVLEGYLIGVPAALLSLIGVSFSVFAVRLFSVTCWLFVHLYFWSVVAKLLKTERHSSLALAPLVLYSITFPTLSYQNLTGILYALSASCLIAVSRENEKWPLATAAFLILIAVLPYLPAVPLSIIWLSLLFFCFKHKRQRLAIASGIVFAFLVIGIIALKEYHIAMHTQLPALTQRSVAELPAHILMQLYALLELIAGPLIPASVLLAGRIWFGNKTLWVWIITGIILWGGHSFVVPFISNWNPLGPAGRLAEIAVILTPAALWEIYRKIDPQSYILVSYAFLISGSAAILQLMLGSLNPQYYLSYLTPLIIGVALLVFFKGSIADVLAAGLIFFVLVLDGSRFAVSYTYRGPSPLSESLVVIESPLFYPIHTSPERKRAFSNLRKFYRVFNCSNKPFIAIDRTPLAYLITGDHPPWKTSWIGDRELVKNHLTDINEYCIVFRGTAENLRRDFALKEDKYSIISNTLGEGDIQLASVSSSP